MIKELKHLGTSVMDVYTGSLPVNEISAMRSLCFLKEKELSERESFFRLDRYRNEGFQNNLIIRWFTMDS